MGVLSFFSDPWIEFFICIYIYFLAAYYSLKELLFEATHQGIERKLLDEIDKSPLIKHRQSKTAIVTGADGTIGTEIVKRLLSYGFTVHALVGDKDRASISFNSEKAAIGRRTLKIYPIGFQDPFELLDFAEQFAKGPSSLDLVVLSAGTMLAKEKRIDGVESHMCINVTSHALLLDTIKGKLTSNARIVALSSACSHAAHLPQIYNKEHVLSSYLGPYQSYAFSKLVLSSYVHELASIEKLPIVSVHPGVVPGTLYRHTKIYLRIFIYFVLPFLMRKPRFASLLVLHTALRRDFTPGSYYEDCIAKNVFKNIAEKDRQTVYEVIKAQLSEWKSTD